MAVVKLAWKREMTRYSDKFLPPTGCLTQLLTAQPPKVSEQDGNPIAHDTAFAPRLAESQYSAQLSHLGLCFYLFLCEAPT